MISPMLLGTITKTWVGWIAWTKILASTESLSALRNGGCHCSCLCLMLPWKILGYFTGSQMEAIQDLSICWVSKEKLLIFTAENARLENVELALLDAQSCCLKRACKSTWISSPWWAGTLSSKQPDSKKMCLLWNKVQVHLWKVQSRASHWLFFCISQQTVMCSTTLLIYIY